MTGKNAKTAKTLSILGLVAFLAPLIIFLVVSPPSLMDFKIIDLMNDGNNGFLLIPANCQPGNGKEGVDFAVGHGLDSTKGISFRTACWYTTKSFRRFFPELTSTPDAEMRSEQYKNMGFKEATINPWASSFTSVIPVILLIIFLLKSKMQKIKDD